MDTFIGIGIIGNSTMSDANRNTGSRVADPPSASLRHVRVELSPQEYAVVKWAADGRSYEDIADKLGVDESTVSTYAYRARNKMDDQAALIDALLEQHRDAGREKEIAEIGEKAARRLDDLGVDAEFTVEWPDDTDSE